MRLSQHGLLYSCVVPNCARELCTPPLFKSIIDDLLFYQAALKAPLSLLGVTDVGDGEAATQNVGPGDLAFYRDFLILATQNGRDRRLVGTSYEHMTDLFRREERRTAAYMADM